MGDKIRVGSLHLAVASKKLTVKRKKLKIFLIVILLVVAGFFLYVEIVNRNSRQMTYRQKVLKAIYPAWMWYNRVTGKRSTVAGNDKPVAPPQSLYDLSVQLNTGNLFRFDSLKGKKILIVNTASNCGYTDQYEDLEKLYEKYKGKGFEIFGVSFDQSKEKWVKAIADDKLTWPHVSDLKGWANEAALKNKTRIVRISKFFFMIIG